MKKILKTLQQHIFFKDKNIVKIDEISSGLSQRSFKIACKNKQHFYAKYFDHDNSVYAQIEKDVLANSASSAITIPLLYSDQHWLITPYIQSNDLSEIDLPIKTKLYIALDLMLTFQKVTIHSENIKPISFISHGEFYISALTLNENQQKVLCSLLSDDDSILIDHEVLCHGDLNFTNMLFEQQLIGSSSCANAKLIDFECCCYAEIEYEIAMMIAVNNLLNYSDVDTIISQIKIYLHTKSIIISQEKVMCYLVKSLFLNALWYKCRFDKTNDAKWQRLAYQQLQQADHFTESRLALSSVFNFDYVLLNK